MTKLYFKILTSKTMRAQLFCFIIFISCTVFAQNQPDFLKPNQTQWVENTMKNMTIDEKIGQLFMPRGNYSGKGYDPQKLMKWEIGRAHV